MDEKVRKGDYVVFRRVTSSTRVHGETTIMESYAIAKVENAYADGRVKRIRLCDVAAAFEAHPSEIFVPVVEVHKAGARRLYARQAQSLETPEWPTLHAIRAEIVKVGEEEETTFPPLAGPCPCGRPINSLMPGVNRCSVDADLHSGVRDA